MSDEEAAILGFEIIEPHRPLDTLPDRFGVVIGAVLPYLVDVTGLLVG